MQKLYPYILFLPLLLLNPTLHSQVNSSSGSWMEIGDTNLSIVYTDADNGDGVADGALFVDGQSAVVGQGTIFTFGGTMYSGEPISIDTYTYNDNVSYVRFNVELYNATDGTVLASTPSAIVIQNNTTPPVLVNLSYIANSSDVGDVLQVRYIRTDPGDTYRNLVIDNLALNGSYVSLSLGETCPFTLSPDLSLIASNSTIEAEIVQAVAAFSDSYLGTSAPSASNLANAESLYDALNISVSGGVISGDPISSFSDASFLRTFAQHLKFNPSDTNIKVKANNTVWWVSLQFCSGALSRDIQMYSYEDFARPASLTKDFLDQEVRDLFAYTLFEHSGEFEHFWIPSYDATYQTANGSINTDLIYNISDVMLAYSLWYDDADERYRYMRGFKRHLERFFSYTVGTSDGIKPDGSGFHHWNAYNNYMYAYKTAASLLYYLRGTSFQVDQSNYQVFRDAVYNQFIQANDDGLQALSTNGRRPELRVRQFDQTSLKRLALAGGEILGLSSADPIFAGTYNRIYGVDSEFNYSNILPFTEGFFQFNHSSSSAFRKNNWIAFNKGFSNNMWGSEIYTTGNRYGRYQSYGALEVIYPGDKISNGYNVDTWDWNLSPGATVIRLPWSELHAEWERIDELQQNRFVGALALSNLNSELLSEHHGTYGLFSMNFQEVEGHGWGTNHSSNNHNNTFTFKKSNFYFDDIIVCLASGISNNDTSNPTITTLYQRLDNSGNGVNVNGGNQSGLGEIIYNGSSNNWVLSNYDTGFYLIGGDHSLVINKASQQNPNYNQIWPVDFSSNPTDIYYSGYIDHGTNPSNKGYEYILLPGSSISEMQNMDTAISGGNKPYTVHQQNSNAHIIEHISKNIWGYSFFTSTSGLSFDKVTGANSSCLIMTEFDNQSQELLIALSNPDIGYESRSFAPAVTTTKQITLDGEWEIINSNPYVIIISADQTETVLEFTTLDGKAIEVQLKEIIVVGCTNEEVINDGFESGFGNWNDGGSDCARSSSNPNTGQYSIRLRDNSGNASAMYTDVLDLSGYDEVSIDFSYYPFSMENNEDFFLEVSTNGGSSYSIYQSWASGTDFTNNNRYDESITFSGITFTSNSVIRIRCDASGNNDHVYIDDVIIQGCSESCLPGSPCDDGDVCTINDVYDVNCDCAGVPGPDTDGDGICDILDICPGFDDTLIGTACDDSDECTSNDMYTTNCICEGTPEPDSDGDGICDPVDLCPGFDDTLIGTSCDDGDICTTNDQYTLNCICEGTPEPDTDGDGVCDIIDICPGFDDTLIGTSCDDGDDCTSNDLYNSNCDCEGTPEPDTDGDGLCDAIDSCPNLDNALIGTTCDDGDECTINDIYNIDCNCYGTVVPDNDGDGYCSVVDPDDNDPCVPDTGSPACSQCGDIITDDFESGFGNWNDGGNDCARNTSYPSSGSYCIRLRDNSGSSSSMTTDVLDMTSYSQVTFNFSYYPVSMENNEDFFLEISTNGGSSYSIYQSWISGTNFNNHNRYYEAVFITGITFTANTVFRLRCDASGNNDQVYIDEVSITDCMTQAPITLPYGMEHNVFDESIQLYPNPVSQLLYVDYGVLDEINATFLLYTVSGQMVRNIPLDPNNDLLELYLDDLSDGLYLVKIVDQDSRTLKTDRIILKLK